MTDRIRKLGPSRQKKQSAERIAQSVRKMNVRRGAPSNWRTAPRFERYALCSMRYASLEVGMIIAEGKPIKEILAMIEGTTRSSWRVQGMRDRLFRGGEKEAGILASALRLARQAQGRVLETKEITWSANATRSTWSPFGKSPTSTPRSFPWPAGGNPVPGREVPQASHPAAVNTQFIGVTEEQGFGPSGARPAATASWTGPAESAPWPGALKAFSTGPAGFQERKCEIDSQVDCGWQLIYDRMNELGQLDKLEEPCPSRTGPPAGTGARKRVREDLKI